MDTNNNENFIIFLTICAIELLLHYFFFKTFLNNLIWKSVVFNLVIGTLINATLSVIISFIPSADLNFTRYLDYQMESVETGPAFLILVIYFISSAIVAFVFRKIITRDKESNERIFRVLFFVYTLGNMILILIYKTNLMNMERDIRGYYMVVTPLVFAVEFISIIGVIVWNKKRIVENKYRSISAIQKTQRGDSNKKIQIFNEQNDRINKYLNRKVQGYKASGIGVDVISYLTDEISCPIDEKEFLMELDQIFDGFEDVRKGERTFLVIGFKIKKEGLIIHFEYNLNDPSHIFSRLLEREYIRIAADHFRLDRRCILTNEILLLYPYENRVMD